MSRPLPVTGLRPALERLQARYARAWLDSDPLRYPRGFAEPDDREVVAVVAALLAFGRVAAIQRAVSAVLERLGPHPARTLAEVPRARWRRRLDGLAHRWTRGSDVAWLLDSTRRLRAEHGSLGDFLLGAAAGADPLRAALTRWHEAADARASTRDGDRRRARAFLLPDPTSGGACKRLLLLARWCIRPDDGIDLGLWRGPTLRPAHLLVPLDVHVHRTAVDLGLTRRPRPDWRAAEEVTAALRKVDADDPVRFDFALARPGIVGRCRHRPYAPACAGCELRDLCRHGRQITTRSRTPSRSPRTTPSRPPCS